MKAPKKFGAFIFLLYICSMKKLIAFLLLANIGYSQYCPALGPDQILPCGIGSTTLTADLSQCGTGANPNQTTIMVFLIYLMLPKLIQGLNCL